MGTGEGAELHGRLLKAGQVAEMLAISTRTLWSLTQRGQFPCIRIGRAVRYSHADVLAWIETARKGSE